MTRGIGVGFGGFEVGFEVPVILELRGIGTEEAIDVGPTAGGDFKVGVTAGGDFQVELTTGAFETNVVGRRVGSKLWAATPVVCSWRISRKPRAPLIKHPRLPPRSCL